MTGESSAPAAAASGVLVSPGARRALLGLGALGGLAFILGVMPLVFATGAGQEGRHSVGTTVVGGMFFATFLNVLFVPILYVIVRTLFPGKLRERLEETAHA